MNRFSAYLRLMRISLLPTAWSNVLMGYVLASGLSESGVNFVGLGLLLVVSSCLYISGMVLNDFFDFELDKVERPERVLPSGTIERKKAGWLGFGLMATGLVVAFGLSIEDGKLGWWVYKRTAAVASILAVCILAYNFRAKRTFLGPWVMGLCRTLNVLLGASLTYSLDVSWYVPVGVGLYVAGITLFAKEEHTTSNRKGLIFGGLMMAAGIGLIAVFPFTNSFNYTSFLELSIAAGKRHRILFLGLLAMMVFPVVRRVTLATLTGSPKDVKQAVITSLLTIIMIDAAICYLVCPGAPEYALSVAALIVPAFLMCRKIMAT